MIQVTIRPEFQNDVSERDVERAARDTLLAESVPDGTELTVVITGDDEIQALNRQYRDLDAPTDVLSFANEEDGAFVTAPDEAPYLGDVIVSFPQARAQATEQGHTTLRELQILVIHGVLHLLGYDHATPDGQREMWSQQDSILEALAEENDGQDLFV